VDIDDVILDLQEGSISFKDARRLADEVCLCESELEEVSDRIEELERRQLEDEDWNDYLNVCMQFE
tara:strand:- start:1674 stop:1871 length:198 start_codon:yes stop_codon:yes gene_type:complete